MPILAQKTDEVNKKSSLNCNCLIFDGYLQKRRAEHKFLDDMSPFFIRDTTKDFPNDVFQNYNEILSEIIIRLPYQMRKFSELKSIFDFNVWSHYLCEYLMLPQCNFLKRLIKKLLQLLCGSKEQYRKFKDHHLLMTSVKRLINICPLSSAPLNLDQQERSKL